VLSTPLVGRNHELSRLQAALDGALARRGGSVLVSGAAGIGKTTLAQAIAAEARNRGARIYTGACYDLTTTPPYGLWRDLVARADGAADLDSPLALLAHDDAWETAANVGAFIRHMREAIERLAADTPVVLVLEDLHWADAPSLELLRDLVRRLESLPVLTLATYRGNEIGRDHPLSVLIPVMVRESGADRLELRPLSSDAVIELIESRYPAVDRRGRDRLVAYLMSHAEGNALFATELLRSLEETGAVGPGGASVAADLEAAPVPALLRQVIDARVARLGPEARRPLEIASVIGQEVLLSVWREVAELSDEALLAVVEPAIAANVLQPTPDGESVTFGHALFREAIYDGILPLRRRAWHRAVGEALAAGSHPDPDRVADHFAGAGDPRAVEWLVKAGERAHRAYAERLAGGRFLAAAEVLERHEPGSPERPWLLYRAGRCLRFADPTRAVRLLERALEAADPGRDPLFEAYGHFDLGMLRCFVREVERGVAEMERALPALEALGLDVPRLAGRTAWLADAMPRREALVSSGQPPSTSGMNAGISRAGTLAMFYAIPGRFAQALQMAERYRPLVDSELLSDPLVVGAAADAFWAIGHADAYQGRPETATAAYERATTLMQSLDHHVVVTFFLAGYLNEVVHPYYATDRALHAKVWEAMGRSTASAEEAFARIFRIEQQAPLLLVFHGEWEAAKRAAEEAHGSDEIDVWQASAVALASIARWSGDRDPTRLLPAIFRDARERLLPNHMFAGRTEGLAIQAEIAMDAGDLEEARSWIEAHERWVDQAGAARLRPRTGVLWSRWHLLHGDPAGAEEAACRAIDAASDPAQPPLRAMAFRALAESLTVQGRCDEAAAAAQESIDLFAACEAPFERAQSEVTLAEALISAGRAVEAGELLASARAVCERLGAQLLITRIAAAERLGAAQPARAAHPGGLSEREVEVVRLVAAGRSNAEIGEALFISVPTVKRHLTNILGKLDLPSRSALNTWAHRHELT
jgi:DNA-binding NarL/FixJ family response regulator